MSYKYLLNKYRTKNVFIYGRSVIQIVEKEDYVDDGVLKTDFIYHTERNRRGVITIDRQKQVDEKFAV